MSEKDEDTLNFEGALSRLESIVARMENESLSLEESLKLYEEGVTLTKFCQRSLTEAEQKITYISEHLQEP